MTRSSHATYGPSSPSMYRIAVSFGFLNTLCLLRVASIASVLSPCPSLCVGGVGFHVLLLEPNYVAWAAPGGVGFFK